MHAGLRRAEELLGLLAAHGADQDARDDGGRTAAEVAEARGLGELAALIRQRKS